MSAFLKLKRLADVCDSYHHVLFLQEKLFEMIFFRALLK